MSLPLFLAIGRRTQRSGPLAATMLYPPFAKEKLMKELLLQFDDDETTLERLTSLAGELGVTPEQWVRRAIASALGDYGLREVPPDFKPKELTDLFVASGVMKPKT